MPATIMIYVTLPAARWMQRLILILQYHHAVSGSVWSPHLDTITNLSSLTLLQPLIRLLGTNYRWILRQHSCHLPHTAAIKPPPLCKSQLFSSTITIQYFLEIFWEISILILKVIIYIILNDWVCEFGLILSVTLKYQKSPESKAIE